MDRWPETRSNHAGTQIFMRVVASILGAIVLFVLLTGPLPGVLRIANWFARHMHRSAGGRSSPLFAPQQRGETCVCYPETASRCP
jgi:hypothetical protein